LINFPDLGCGIDSKLTLGFGKNAEFCSELEKKEQALGHPLQILNIADIAASTFRLTTTEKGTKKTYHVLQPQHISNVPSDSSPNYATTATGQHGKTARDLNSFFLTPNHITSYRECPLLISWSRRQDKTLGHVFPSFMNRLLSNDSSTGNAPV
jgi:hypothetical protein